MKILKFKVFDNLTEYIGIELQGTLETHLDRVDSVRIGNLTINEDNTAILVIDGLKLRGKVQTLPKKRLVISNSPETSELLVEGIVRTKIVFTERPFIVVR
ncbi:hypothetical protein GEMRC1_008207 [Eukaryota sp. GEM-RC1]